MLKEKGVLSQGRLYLLISVIVYYITLGIILFAGIHTAKDGDGLDMGKFEIIIEALKYAMMLFGGYVFGGKFIDVIKIIGGRKEDPPKKEIL
jgi:hypothetical protein